MLQLGRFALVALALLLGFYACKKKVTEPAAVTLPADCGCAAYYDSLIVIPNAITPNGDGSNDEFRPFFYKIPDVYSISIINPKDGKTVFTATEVADGWNGKTNGKVEQGRFEANINFTVSGKNYNKIICVSVVNCVLNNNCHFLDEYLDGKGFTAPTMEKKCP
jgi:gliding motility-associated-like protein